MNRLASLLVAMLAFASLACAAPCERVQASHDAFRKATQPIDPQRARSSADSSEGAAHMSMSVPYELIDVMIAKELARVPKLKLPLGSVAGVSLGSLQVAVDAVRARKARPGELGFRVTIGLREGKRTILAVDVDARVRPRLDARAGTLAVALSGRDVIALAPSISQQSRQRLGDWIYSQLPAAARMVTDKRTVTKLAGELADQLMKQAAGLLERELLDDLGELVRFELDLPDELPIRTIELAAGERYLDIDLRTSLRVAHGLAPGRERLPELHPNLVQVRISGAAMAALVNHGIREGRIPGRWTLQGEADPEGEIWAGVGWAEGQADPLELHLWKLEQDCAHVILRGQPDLRVDGRELEVRTDKIEVASVVGSLKVKAALFFWKTTQRGRSLIERTAASTEVEIGTSMLTARVAEAEVRGDEVVLGLALAPARSR